MRIQKMPYQINAEENVLKRLRLRRIRDFLVLKNFRPHTKGLKISFIGYWGGQEGVVGFGFKFVFFEAIAAHSFPSNYRAV